MKNKKLFYLLGKVMLFLFCFNIINAHAQSEIAKPSTYYSFVSQEGDKIGQGKKFKITSDQARFEVLGSASNVNIRVIFENEVQYDITFVAPLGEKLHPGIYTSADITKYAMGRAPGLLVQHQNYSCSQIWGNFTIRQINFKSNGEIKDLDASFGQRCDSQNAPLLSGSIGINTLPLSFSFKSDKGEVIGNGEAKTYTNATSILSLDSSVYDQKIYFQSSGNRNHWWIRIAPPLGQNLYLGTFLVSNARDEKNGLLEILKFNSNEVSKGFQKCSGKVTGKVTINNIVFNRDKQVTGLNASFEQYCNGKKPALRGTIHYLQ